MSKKIQIFKSTAFHFISLVFSVIASILFRSSRTTWVFINKTVGIESFSIILLILMIIDAVALGSLLAIRLYSDKDKNLSNKKIFTVLTAVFSALSAVFLIFALIYAVGLFFGENNEVYTLNFRKTLSEGYYLILIPFLAVFFPKLSSKIKKPLTAALIIITALFGINSFCPFSVYKITSQPMVIDNGKEYSIVFSTNDQGTGFAEYTYKGKEYKVFDNTGGRLNSDSRIHSISIPYEHLRNNSYTIGSTRVIEQFSYGSRTGKTVISDEYKFTYNESENQTWLVVSDWHTMVDKAAKAVSKFTSDYDAVILLGDSSPGVDFEQQVITNTVQFAGSISGGTKPVIYTRGNHETRGAYAKDLPVALGLEQFYYTTDIGPYSFVILDSGEDKEDSHIEYGGMNDYETYRYDMIEWLKGVETKNDKVIALSHAWQISSVEDELSDAGWQELDRLDTRLLISGHEHKCRFLGSNDGKEKVIKEKYPDIIGYIDGGKVNDDYIASMLTLNSDGFEIYAVDTNGNEIVKESFEW